MRTFLLFFLSIFVFAIEAHEAVVRSPVGEVFVLDVDPCESYIDVVQQLQSHFGSDCECFLDFMWFSSEQPIEKASPSRNYWVPISAGERNEIAYITNTLGVASLAKIAKSKSALKKAGERVNHVHPLRFLMCIFTDNEMKASVAALQGRAWVWEEFYSGIRNSCEEESNRNNMHAEYVFNFAAAVGIDGNIIYPYVVNRQWREFVKLLIDLVPRGGNTGRYNM